MKKIIALFLTSLCMLFFGCNNEVALKAEDCPLPANFSLPQKTIYAVGEATHGSAEFTLIKQNVFEYLVKERGVRAFCLEADFGEMLKINSMLYDETWNAQKTIKQLNHWVYEHNEMVNLLQWIRDYNASAPEEEKIRIYGFDFPSVKESSAWLLELLKRTLPDLGWKHQASGLLFQLADEQNMRLSDYTPYLTQVNELAENLHDHEEAIIAASSDREYDIAIQIVNCLKFCLLHQQSNLELDSISLELDSSFNYDSDKMTEAEIKEYGEKRVALFNERDAFMADIVAWIVEHEQKYYGKKAIFITGHNYHISKEPNRTEGFSAEEFPMGYRLKEEFQEAYCAIGTEFGVGWFYAWDMDTNKLKAFSLENTLPISEYFQGIEDTVQYVNSSELQTLFRTPIKMHSIGGGFADVLVNNSNRFTVTISPSEAYDGLLYFPSVHAFNTIYAWLWRQ